MRVKGHDGIGRAIYVTAFEQRIVIVHAFRKKSRKTPTQAVRLALERLKDFEIMTISFDETRKKWFKEPAFLEEYEALEPEFRLAKELIKARSSAGLSQRQVAELMGTSQSAVARLESGHKPSFKSLERYAEALGMNVEVRLVPR